MTYDPLRKAFVIPADDMTRAAHYLRWSMNHIRCAAGLPLDRYKQEGAMQSPDFAQAGIFEAAKCLGLDLGATRPEDLDLRDER
jgi:hypothetical protein